MRKVYFAGSIRGGRQDADLYKEIIDYINKTEKVLTEHVGDINYSFLERTKDKDELIYNQDMGWLKESDLLIGECTTTSLGVGYELGFAESHNIPCYILYDKNRCVLSAMVTGNKYFKVYPYETKEEIFKIIDEILGR